MAHEIDATIADWQAIGHEIGMIEFASTADAPECFPYYLLPPAATFLGVMEVDAVCLMEDGTICVFDNASETNVCPAAANQAAFVAALRALEQHFEKCVADEAYCDDMNAAVGVREHCTKLAGGDAYGSFFASMVGA